MRLSPEEIAQALMTDYQIRLQDDEIRALRDYFMNKYKTREISQTAFFELLQTKFERKSDPAEARKALHDIKGKLEMEKKSPKGLIAEFNQEHNPDQCSIRTFKIACNSLKVLTQYNIDNLAKHMDKQNDGFISVQDFQAQVSSSFNPDATHKSGSAGGLGQTMGTTGKYNNKWA